MSDLENNNFLSTISKRKVLTREEEQQLFTVYINTGDMEIRNKLVEHNIRLVYSLAASLQHVSELSIDDLANEGIFGLITAIDKFDPTLGNKFSTYASYWIKQAMFRAIQNQSRSVRIPVHQQEISNKVRDAITNYKQSHGKEPTTQELLAFAPHLTEKNINDYHYIKDTYSVLSLDETYNEEDDVTLGDLVSSDICSPNKDLEEKSVSEMISDCIDKVLNERERFVIRSRFGFDGKDPRTLESIAQQLGITRERVRQIESLAMRKLSKSPEFRNCGIAA